MLMTRSLWGWKMSNPFKDIAPIFMWQDRAALFVHLCEQKPPLPLILSFLIENKQDMSAAKWRKLNGILDLPVEMAYGLLCAVVEPKRQRINWPKRKTEAITPPYPFRHNDNYWQDILKHDWLVRNEVRLLNDDVPKFMKKKMEESKWVG